MSQEQISADEVKAVFGLVRTGVLAAFLAALSLAIFLTSNRSLPLTTAIVWTGYIGFCASAHIALREFYLRDDDRDCHWRHWGYAFASLAFAEGLGWGWASISLATDGRVDTQFLVLLVTQSIAAGSIPAFGRYLPAFLALFVPTTVPYVVMSLSTSRSMEQASGLMMILYIVALIWLGIGTNRQFRQVLTLQLQTSRLVTEVRRQKEVAEAANRAKSSFLAAASHDLRQPVHALGLFVGALKLVNMPAEAADLVEQIHHSSQAMDNLFAALLDISRLDAGVVEVHKRAFEIDSILDRISFEFASEATAKLLLFKRCRSSVHVESDPILVERIVRNLVSNAVRYTEVGKILVGCRRRGQTLKVQVWDTGPGIPVDQREKIFQEYYQLGNPERDRSKGLGLGLAIVRRLTSLLDITVRVKSGPGGGTCFEIDLPIAPHPTMSRAELPVSAVVSSQKRHLIVVVDDEAPIRAGMHSVLSGWGHDVVIAASGKDAMAKLANIPRRPDLIVCDLRLRGNELGTSVVETLRTEYNEVIPAILVTGDTAPDRLAEAKASGLLLLHKPVSNARLRAALTNVIANAENVDDPA